MLPPDSHVHSQWSWDALAGSMEATCRRALELGLPSVAFTEHADLTPWTLRPGEEVPQEWRPLLADGVLTPPALDLDGYRDCLESCRQRHPDLRILSGIELSEPHWHTSRAGALLGVGGFERVLASVHSAPAIDGSGFTEVSTRYDDQPPADVVRAYLAETVRLIEQFDAFEVLAHIDYPVRYWPADAKPYDPFDFEEEYRHVLRCLAAADKVLEVNTRVPLHPQVLAWWREEGGQAITFASDAHDPGALARGFADAVQMAEATGFRPGRDPHAFWGRG
ncbi:PHP domain-containing protein [Kitasatospora acidiphila]|uniref:Histidinol-phosphatase n=1 Tax=Kitasatospora acidiphila TaxID=2567942 RepID=A0A540WD98_9ACTN|nr:PHP domain-containing protein [Kitasatospora acidiphila]TQF07020.1 PHP domain-containing protein [Kitasatospora acidiphila]